MKVFVNNKYTKWYNQIIQSSQENPNSGYTERHHIIPKCLKGSDDKSNIAILSARQHFICHLLLTKMVEKEHHKVKLRYAAILISHTRDDIYTSNRMYALLRANLKHTPEWIAKRAKSRTGCKYSEESKKRISDIAKKRHVVYVSCVECKTTLDYMNYCKIHAGNCKKSRPPPWNKGKQMATKGKVLPKTRCPHCNKVADVGNYTRWHGDKCKHKESV